MQDTCETLYHAPDLRVARMSNAQMLEAAEGGLVEARRAAVATAERGDRLEAERDSALRQVEALQAALAGESASPHLCTHGF